MSTAVVVRRTLAALTLGLMFLAPGLILAADGLTTLPKKPGKFRAAGNAQTAEIDMTWKDKSTDETGFRIERAPGNCPLTGWTALQSVPANSTSYNAPMTDINLPKTSVSFRTWTLRGAETSKKPSKCVVVTCSQCH